MSSEPRFISVTGLIYPESGDINSTLELLEYNGISGYCSPLHEPDEEIKKPHYHVNCVQPPRHGLSLKRWRDIFETCGLANGYVHVNNSFVKAAKYLLHLEQPVKQQFPNKTVREFGDPVPYNEFIKDKVEYKKQPEVDYYQDVIKYINQTSCYNYASLMLYAIECKPEWVNCVKKNHSSILAFMRSCVYAKGKSFSDNSVESAVHRIVQAQNPDNNVVLNDYELNLLINLKNVGLI